MAVPDPFLWRSLPNDLDAERAVLGAILLDNTLIAQALEVLQPEHFYLGRHRLIYEIMLKLSAEGYALDPITIGDELKARNKFEQAGGGSYLAGLIDSIPRLENISQYTTIVRRFAARRELIRGSYKVIQAGLDGTCDYEEAAEMAGRAAVEAMQPISGHASDLETPAQVAAQSIAVMREARQAGGPVGVAPSGLAALDAMLGGGGHRHKLIIIAGRTSAGKTALALNWAENAARRGIRGLYVSMEMPPSELLGRLAAARAGVSTMDVISGHLTDAQAASYEAAILEVTDGLRLDFLTGEAKTTLHLRSRMTAAKLSGDPYRALYVDHLQLMRPLKPTGSRNLDVGSISRDLKGVAMEYGIPVFALSQLSRDHDKRDGSDGRPRLSDLRDSGEIEQDADAVLFVYRAILHNVENADPSAAELILAKHRNGPTGVATVVWRGDKARFSMPMMADFVGESASTPPPPAAGGSSRPRLVAAAPSTSLVYDDPYKDTPDDELGF